MSSPNLMTAGATALAAAAIYGCGSSDDSPKGATHLSVKLTDAGCDPASLKAPAGPITFDVTGDSDSVTELEVLQGEKILGERENLTSGLDGSVSLTLEKGTYVLSCPNGSSDPKGKLVVSGSAKASQSPALQAAANRYRDYVERNTDLLVSRTKPFVAAVIAGDLARAKTRYPAARIPYERVEPVAESFGNLDPEVDARANDVPSSQFGGFHRIEKALWADGSTTGMAPVARALLADVERLQRKATGLQLEAAQIANGSSELLDEVSASKITGEEERYSHIDLVDFQANVDGSRAAFSAVEPILQKDDPDLAREIEQRFDDVDRALDPYRRGSGFVLYGALTEADKRKLAQAIDALAEPLSEVSAHIVS